MSGRIISNCEQCAHFWHKWDFERRCKLKKREIETKGIPEWCPWPKSRSASGGEGER